MATGFPGKKFTGARARFSILGQPVGYARSVSGSERVVYEPNKVLDNIRVDEHVPVAYECDLRASFVRIIGESIKKAGWFPKTGITVADHLKNILERGELSVLIEDSATSTPMETYEQVKMTSHNWRVDAQGIVGQDVEFVAIRVTTVDE